MDLIVGIVAGIAHHGVTIATGAVLVVLHDHHMRARGADHHHRYAFGSIARRAGRRLLRRPAPVSLVHPERS